MGEPVAGKQALRLEDFVPYRLSVATNLVSDVIATAYDTLFGLKIPEWRLIAVLAEADHLTQLDIGLRTRMDKVTVSRAAASLVHRRLIRRKPNPRDQRSRLLALTPMGRKLYAQVAPTALNFEAELLADLPAEEIDALLSALHKLELAAERIAERRKSREGY